MSTFQAESNGVPSAQDSENWSWLHGRRIALVGRLGSMSRNSARQLLREIDCEIVDRAGPDVDLIIVSAEQDLLENAESLLGDSVLQAAGEGKLEIITETEFWTRGGVLDGQSQSRSLYTPAMLARVLNVPISTIRRWHRRGLIEPVRQVNKLSYFDFEQVASARRLAKWIAEGKCPKSIESKLAKLAERFPSMRRPWIQLNAIIESRDILLRRGEGLVDHLGQMRFDFDSAETPDEEPVADRRTILPFPEHAPPPDLDQLEMLIAPDEFLQLAIQLEDAERLDEAAEVYRSMMLSCGPSADICFRVAEVLYQLGDLAGARERYYMAVELEESFVEARASLGCVLVELGQPKLAIAAFEGALQSHPDYPDVHFHLARLLDQSDQRTRATEHWRRFLELAAHSPWADEARFRLGCAETSDEPADA